MRPKPEPIPRLSMAKRVKKSNATEIFLNCFLDFLAVVEIDPRSYSHIEDWLQQMKDVIPLGRRGGLKEKPTETNKRKPDELEDPEEMNASKVRVTSPQRVIRLVRTPSPSPPPFSPIPLPPSPNPRTSPTPERYPPSTDRKVRNDSHRERMPTTTRPILPRPHQRPRERSRSPPRSRYEPRFHEKRWNSRRDPY